MKFANLLPLLGLVLWPFCALMSPMFFDAPGSEENLLVWALYYTVIAYPLPTVAGAIWFYCGCKENNGWQCIASTLTTYSAVFAIILILIAFEIVRR